MPALALRAVVGGRPELPVRWVAVSELADPAPYLEGGELLLTTGLATHADGWTGSWAGYVERLAGAGAAALGFGVGLSHSAVPADLIAAAAGADLALLLVPESTPFIAISKAVARLIAEEERESTAAALLLQQKLTRAIVQRNGRRRVLALLADASGGDAGLVHADGTTITPAAFRPNDAARRALRTLRDDARPGAVTEVDDSGTTVVQPIGTTAPDAHLVLATPTPPDGVVRAALAATVALLTLDIERSRAAADAELRLRDCAARLVLDGAPDAARSITALVTGAPGVPDIVQVLHGERVPKVARAHVARAHPAALMTAVTDGRITVVLDPADVPQVERLLAELGCRVGTGTAVPLAQAGLSAAAAATAVAAATDRAPVVRWDEHFRGDIRAGLSADAARVLATRILGELTTEPDLRRTLRAYLAHLGRWQPTADELGIHRNTLRKRMERIGVLLGRDVDTAAGRADLWIALEIADGQH
ncbi:PucR family transcriptional regulator ligand-binding domain-containing protein [Pseudonocardia sp. CA-107938]|uniref:helix-turn-helix domain-containing protein n=1 Tax=Pseudonocardia sp. CA-107938 TaxID=3240021 RepID=UPI003D9174DA